MDLSKVKTCKLVDELRKREGVESYEISPYEESYEIKKGPKLPCSYVSFKRIDKYGDKGGAIILEVID